MMNALEQEKKGFFIVCEGLDGAGKTTTVKRFIERQRGYECKDYFYSKGLNSNTSVGRLVGKIQSTFMFLLELAYITQLKVKPALRKNKVVFQDRYAMSILSFVPTADKWYNQLAAFIIKPYLIKPDLLVYFEVPLEERIKRLKSTSGNKYHALLVKHPHLIDLREKKYLELFNSHHGNKVMINTANKSIDAVVDEFESATRKKISAYN